MARFVATYAPGRNWTDAAVREAAKQRQAAYFADGVQRGHVVMAGDLGEGEVLALLEAPSLAAAERFAARDPAVLAFVFEVRVRKFEVDPL